jgi:hypothetical protein
VKKNYQNQPATASRIVVPEQVSAAMAETAENMWARR